MTYVQVSHAVYEDIHVEEFIQRNHFGGGGGGGGGELQEVGVALYTFLYNYPKFGGGGRGELPPSG